MRLQILVMMVAVAALSGCGNKGSGGGEAPPVQPTGPALPSQVQSEAFTGRPGSFSGIWRGACTVHSQGLESERCSITVNVKQGQGMLDVETDMRFVFRGMAQKSKLREVYTIQGNTIAGREGRTGQIGREAFTLTSPPNDRSANFNRTTLVRTGRGEGQLTIESQSPQFHAVLKAELKTSSKRDLPRARRTNARN
ncbi:MAG: hypothetical protein V4760_08135 [Bdellovibrionota bacterium]